MEMAGENTTEDVQKLHLPFPFPINDADFVTEGQKMMANAGT